MTPKELLEKGEQLNKDGKYDEAIACFDAVLTAEPQNAEAMRLRGDAVDNKGNIEKERRNIGKALEYYNEAMVWFRNAIKIKPDFLRAINNLGYTLLKCERYEEAIMTLNKIIGTKSSVDNRLTVSKAYDNLGMALFNQGCLYGDKDKFNEAINNYKEALKTTDPTDKSSDWGRKITDRVARINNNIATVYVKLEKYKIANTYFETSKEDKDNKDNKDNTEKARALNGIGWVYLMEENYDKVITHYNETISEIKEHPTSLNFAYWNRGMAYINKRLIKNATYDFNKTERLDTIKLVHQLESLTDEQWEEFTQTISLDNDEFFSEMAKSEAIYKKLYIVGLRLMAKLFLRLNDDDEVATYTKTETLKSLLGSYLDKKSPSPYRLNAGSCMNDPNEAGETDKYIMFLASFIMNSDSLNMFRLYGKDSTNREATGVSILFRPAFFNADIEGVMMPLDRFTYHPSLYRVMYVKNDDVVTVGQRKNENFDFSEIKSLYGELCELKKGLDKTIVDRLLMPLNSITKSHVWLDENECRIVQIVKKKDFKIKSDPFLYVNYIAVDRLVKRICFGSNVDERTVFMWKYILADKGIEVKNSEAKVRL